MVVLFQPELRRLLDQIGKGKKSMAFSFELRSDERTLTDEDINRAVNTILKALKFRLDAVLRS